MKKMLIAAITVAAIAVIAFGVIGTGAWFTDTDSVAGNTLAAGTLNIDLRGDGGTAVPLTVQNLAPGEWKPVGTVYKLGAENLNSPASTIPVKYRMAFANVVNDPAATNLTGAMTVRVKHSFAGTDTTNWPTVYEGPFNSFLIESTVTSGILGQGILNVNNTHVYVFEFMLNESAGNEYQGAKATFDLKLDGFQVADPVF